jgi:glycosyltransferase involved in cell wall biosynthesis
MQHWVIVLGWLDIGGAERQALKFARDLVSRNHRVTIVGLSSPGRVLEECARLGIDCLYFPCDLDGPWRRKLKSIFLFWWRMFSLRPTYLAPYTMLPNVLCGLVWRLTSATSCVWQQRDEGRLRQDRLLEKLAVRWTPRFISNSDHGRSWLISELGVMPYRIDVIRNGISVERETKSSKIREKLGLPKDVLIVTMVANLHCYKDHMTLLKAWKILKTNEPNLPCYLVLAGRHDNAFESIATYIRQEGLSGSVICPGSIDDVPGLLSETTVFAFSSRNEGCSNAILEAMAAGLPVIATDVPANREALGDINIEYLVEPGNSEAMAYSLKELLENSDLGKQVGGKNRERIKSDFAESAMAERTIRVFRDHAVGYFAKLLGIF